MKLRLPADHLVWRGRRCQATWHPLLAFHPPESASILGKSTLKRVKSGKNREHCRGGDGLKMMGQLGREFNTNKGGSYFFESFSLTKRPISFILFVSIRNTFMTIRVALLLIVVCTACQSGRIPCPEVKFAKMKESKVKANRFFALSIQDDGQQ